MDILYKLVTWWSGFRPLSQLSAPREKSREIHAACVFQVLYETKAVAWTTGKIFSRLLQVIPSVDYLFNIILTTLLGDIYVWQRILKFKMNVEEDTQQDVDCAQHEVDFTLDDPHSDVSTVPGNAQAAFVLLCFSLYIYSIIYPMQCIEDAQAASKLSDEALGKAERSAPNSCLSLAMQGLYYICAMDSCVVFIFYFMSLLYIILLYYNSYIQFKCLADSLY